MKKNIRLALLFALAVSLLAGCGLKAQTPFTAENEILTYTKVDTQKTQLSVSSLGVNVNLSALATAFMAQNPDVQIIRMDLTSGTKDYKPVLELIRNGEAPDVMFVNSDTFDNDEQVIQYMTDLSTNPAIENVEAAALERVAVGGFVYFLPAPSEINCILYNKTMFEQYGWEVPSTVDEFIALCLRIREDTGGAVQPWNPNAKYDNVLTTALEAFAYGELFGGKDNRVWYNAFCDGKATFAGHMEPFYDMLQKLIDNGLITQEHFNYSATTRGKDFETGKLAMYNAPISKINNEDYTFDYMPYPSTDGETGFVNDVFCAMLCVPKKEHSKAETDALNRFLAFFGSVDGQRALIGNSLMVSNVKGVPLNDSEALAGIEKVIAQGHTFSRLDFPGAGTRTWLFRDNALAMVKGEKTGAEIIAEIDAHPYLAADESGTDSATRLADATENFSMLEFSFYIADMYRETAGADIGLINHGIAYRGNLVRVYKGAIYDTYMYPFRPRSFANGSTLVKLSMTGRQIIDALNHPVGYNIVSDSIYAFSGLRCEVAPWNALGSKYLSVRLADGSALELDQRYTVAAWAGTVADEYITETLETCEGAWDDLMAAKLKSDGVVAPAKDGRIKLVWQ